MMMRQIRFFSSSSGVSSTDAKEKMVRKQGFHRSNTEDPSYHSLTSTYRSKMKHLNILSSAKIEKSKEEYTHSTTN